MCLSSLVFPVAAVAAVAAAVAPGARAAQPTTVTRLRLVDGPASVRVVVDFVGQRVIGRTVEAVDGDPLDGRVRVAVAAAGAASGVPPRSGPGVRAAIVPSSRGLTVQLTASARAFKYLGYTVGARPNRLTIDLWKSAPPSPAAAITIGRRNCLTLTSWSATQRTVIAAGAESVFEGQFVVRVRDGRGEVVAERPVAGAASGAWTARLRYGAASGPYGTLEAVDPSEKDGAIACLVQVRVPLRGSLVPVHVFYGRAHPQRCDLVVGVRRLVRPPRVLDGTMAALLRGPTPAERRAGLHSWFSAKTAGMLRSVRIADGVAYVDFRNFSRIIPNASTSCGSAALLAELDRTATQFPTVGRAVYSFDGSRTAFYDWLQLDVPA